MIYSAHNYWLVLVSVVAGAVGFLIFGIRHLSGSTTADTALISTPALVVMAAACVTWATLSMVFPTDVACLMVFGLYAGYNYYALLHHLQHRRRTIPACLAGLERVHRIHHHRHMVNYGVTTTLWDRLLGTFQPSHESGNARSVGEAVCSPALGAHESLSS